MSFSAGLVAKIIHQWEAGSGITPVSNGAAISQTWVDSVAGVVGTINRPGGGTANVTYATSAFGTYPGLAFPQPYPPVGFDLGAGVSGVKAQFGLVKPANFTNAGNAIWPLCFLTNTVSAADDAMLGVDARLNRNSTVICYADGVDVGLGLMRRLGAAQVIGAVASAGLATPTMLGAQGFGGYGGTIGAIILLNAVPTQAEVDELTTYLHGLGGTSPTARTTNKLDLWFGNSLISQDNSPGSIVTNNNSTTAGLVARYRSADFQNFGWYGNTASQTLTVAQNQATRTIQKAVTNGYTEIVCYFMGARNDIYGGGNPNTVADTVQTICSTLRTAGATRIVLITEAASDGGGSQATYDANRATYNARLLAMRGTYCNQVVRVDLDANLGPNGSQANATYFTSDQIHWRAVSVERLATLTEAQAFIDPPSQSRLGLSLGIGL